jgi:UDP-N-acetylmuramoyl-tripeptide--D-alanyl-D-alanine ligase
MKQVRTVEFENPAWVASGVSTDSRSTKRGDLFFALRGETFDGHNFISQAVQSWASGIVVDSRWAESNSAMMASLHVPKFVVEDTTQALGQLASVYRSKFKIPLIAVGGSNGKTTTKEMIKAVLSQKFNVLATEGNLNNHIGVPQTLFRLEKKHRVAVVEVGTNHPGEIAYLCGILQPTHGLITNIGHEHLEFFGSIDGVAKAECELFEHLKETAGTAFVNTKDIRLKQRSAGMKKKITYGLGARSAIVRGSIRRWSNDARAVVTVKGSSGKSFEIDLGVAGEHNAANAVAAVAVGLTFGVPARKIRTALETFRGVGKRTQLVERNGVTILNDVYNSNPDSVLAGLATLKMLKNSGKKIAVLADMLELGPESESAHRAVGKALEKFGVEYLLTFGALSNFTHEVAKVKFKFHFEQKNLLSEYLLEILGRGDAVLIKGSRGMKMDDVVTVLNERLKKAA